MAHTLSARECRGTTVMRHFAPAGASPTCQRVIRGKHILDLIITDVPDCTARPGAAVADHKGVLTQVRFKIKEIASHNREVWHFSEADVERLAGNIE